MCDESQEITGDYKNHRDSSVGSRTGDTWLKYSRYIYNSAVAYIHNQTVCGCVDSHQSFCVECVRWATQRSFA